MTEGSEVRVDGSITAAEAVLAPGKHAIEVTHPRTSP